MERPVKLKFPELFAVVLETATPLKLMIAPLPTVAGLMLPEIVYVGAAAVALKFTPVTLALLTVTAWLVGENV